jgi:predicted metal-binding membrane protein
MSDLTTQTLLKNDRAIVAAGLAATTLLAWLYLVTGAGTGMNAVVVTSVQVFDRMAMPSAGSWSASYWTIMLAMWWVMMIAMMLPTAAPAILLYARVHRQSVKTAEASTIPAAAFTFGYLLAWLGFSVVATALQAGMERAGLLDRMMMWTTDRTLTAAFLLAAGIFQLSPLKSVCLNHCRAPVDFLTHHWRQGTLGAVRMGLHHGVFCVGCCWLLMALLFAGGVMNLIWIAGLTILVLVEKLVPYGGNTARAFGLLLVATAAYVLLAPANAAPMCKAPPPLSTFVGAQ